MTTSLPKPAHRLSQWRANVSVPIVRQAIEVLADVQLIIMRTRVV
jgi:hypothetical protein